MSYVKKNCGLCASLWYLTSGKNFIVMRPAVLELLGGAVFHPALRYQSAEKEQMPLSVNIYENNFRPIILIKSYNHNKFDNRNDEILSKYL